jgi:hypothetical protein
MVRNALVGGMYRTRDTGTRHQSEVLSTTKIIYALTVHTCRDTLSSTKG